MIQTTPWRWLSISLGLLVLSATNAATDDTEQLFVTDQIMVALKSEPDSTLEPIAILRSGDPLEQLAQQQGWIKARTPDGTEGWLHQDYVDTTRPAHLELQRVNRQLLALKQRTDELETSLADTLSQNSNQQSGWLSLLFYLLLPAAGVIGFIAGKRREQRKLRRRYGGMRL